MGCLLWAGRLEVSPYSDLLAPSHWDTVALEFTRECCNLLGQAYESPLQVTVSAGSQALPTLIKLATVMANKKQVNFLKPLHCLYACLVHTFLLILTWMSLIFHLMDPKFEVFGMIHINAFIYSLLCWSYHDLSSQHDCDLTIKADYR
jgi:hypothetical protein